MFSSSLAEEDDADVDWSEFSGHPSTGVPPKLRRCSVLHVCYRLMLLAGECMTARPHRGHRGQACAKSWSRMSRMIEASWRMAGLPCIYHCRP